MAPSAFEKLITKARKGRSETSRPDPRPEEKESRDMEKGKYYKQLERAREKATEKGYPTNEGLQKRIRNAERAIIRPAGYACSSDETETDDDDDDDDDDDNDDDDDDDDEDDEDEDEDDDEDDDEDKDDEDGGNDDEDGEGEEGDDEDERGGERREEARALGAILYKAALDAGSSSEED